jgi:hypothetical protein
MAFFGGIARVTREHLSTDKITFSRVSELLGFSIISNNFKKLMKNPLKAQKSKKSKKLVKLSNLNAKTISAKYVKLLFWFLTIPISMQMEIQLSNKKIHGMEKELWNCATSTCSRFI